ncbi:hypothetical protein MPTK1_3g15040 [Marchantia polymorpha subsp. ruderalis]|uniref:Uncharacterized protein n=2 Tax=Marchantia polymorpha TaxID=3197 RepID=A0AAF6B0Y7_MARPO|nr:hypothetical protein MARPO_0004s0168 [Marchantia polymorpha]BBN05671.1 hypothetical protein Mp_3g15040 [Marchantia polymorpha subsp. ruderalis]|eukprot:PTQ48911.1 hypothetical protein MARPO_0004s0168 [Marchantia polymorpha]
MEHNRASVKLVSWCLLPRRLTFRHTLRLCASRLNAEGGCIGHQSARPLEVRVGSLYARARACGTSAFRCERSSEIFVQTPEILRGLKKIMDPCVHRSRSTPHAHGFSRETRRGLLFFQVYEGQTC